MRINFLITVLYVQMWETGMVSVLILPAIKIFLISSLCLKIKVTLHANEQSIVSMHNPLLSPFSSHLFQLKPCQPIHSFVHSRRMIKKQTWLRKNWLWVAGISFLGIHFGTYFIQKLAKQSAKSTLQLKESKNNH
ncbi:hypothetical protein XELAEV_18028527mg [Xenopus laevis]|uniref:Uncharacterized protein n=1 Tax=Xenopus laevis TaxID=8355 RepID=A0A974HGU9_XENLA|nr:hypothetical protein XELAEV_18028527mg [Xenopus laevis]